MIVPKRTSCRGGGQGRFWPGGWIAALLVLGLLAPGAGPAAARPPAQEFIVQGASLLQAAEAVRQVGGEMTHQLGLIQAVGARLTPTQQGQLLRFPHLRVFPNHPLSVSNLVTESVRDDFDQVRYTNDDGTWVWSDAWIETGDDHNPQQGAIYIDGGRLYVRGKQHAIARSVNLSGAVSAELRLDYLALKAFSPRAGAVLEISADGGVTWHTLHRFQGGPAGEDRQSIAFDITPYAALQTVVRLVTSERMPANRGLAIDHIEIVFSRPAGYPPVGLFLRDNFQAPSYRINDGNQPWLGGWIEPAEVTDPTTGQVQIVERDGQFQLDIQSQGEIYRLADLRGATQAQLEVSFRRRHFNHQACLAVYASTDPAQRGQLVGQLLGPADDDLWQVVRYDLSPFISGATRIGFAGCAGSQPQYDLWINRVTLRHNAPWDAHKVGGSIAADLLGADDLVEKEGLSGQGVTVAIIDTGFWSHPNLVNDLDGRPRLLAQYDAIRDRLLPTGVPRSTDSNGHGAHITSLVLSSKPAPDGGYYGLAPNSRLVSIQAFNAEGAGSYLDIIRGIDWAVANREQYQIRVLNLSFSGEPHSYYWDDPLNQAVMRAWQAGLVVVAAAGNQGPSPMSIGVPGNVPYVITVGALSDNYTPGVLEDDFLASFSSAGPTVEGFVKPEVVAPGGHLLGQVSSRAALVRRYSHFWTAPDDFVMSGTSQSAAVVSGLVALILERYPELTPDQVKFRLMDTAHPALSPQADLGYAIFQQGAGLVHAYDAVLEPVDGTANPGLSVDADLAGLQHFGGLANRDKNGVYYIMGENPPSRYAWSGGYSWSTGFSWSTGYSWSTGFSWSTAYSWSTDYAWSNAYSWSTGYSWSTTDIDTAWIHQE